MLKIVSLVFLFLLVPAHFTLAGQPQLPAGSYLADESPFSESLARFVSGTVLNQGPELENGIMISTSVIWIPTYYGYHTFLGVLDTYIHDHTTITALKTRRLADRNFYVIDLSEKEIIISIIYDSVNSLLMLSMPQGY